MSILDRFQQAILEVKKAQKDAALPFSKTPLLPNTGANFKTHQLIKSQVGSLELIASKRFKLFCFVFFGVGLALTIFLIRSSSESENFSGLFAYPPFYIALLFMAAGVFFLKVGGKRIVFDQLSSCFYIGDKNASISLSEIQSLQVLSKLVTSNDDPDYTCYELNIVLTDGKRINILNHGNLEAVNEAAVALQNFLPNKPELYINSPMLEKNNVNINIKFG